MKIAFAGTPEVAKTVIAGILNSPHDVALVLTKPDTPQGRGRKLTTSAVGRFASDQGIKILKPESIKNNPTEVIKALQDNEVDIVVVVAYGLLIPPKLLEVPKYGWINLHYSLLPKWRGAAPVQRAIANGDSQIGVCVFKIQAGIDDGPIAKIQALDITGNETAGEALGRLSNLGVELLLTTLEEVETDNVSWKEQDHQNSTYAPRINKNDAEINWTDSAENIHNLVRACAPNPGAWTHTNGEKILVIRTKLVMDQKILPFDLPISPGKIKNTKNSLYVGTADGVLEIIELKAAGKKQMRASDWARGVREIDKQVWGS